MGLKWSSIAFILACSSSLGRGGAVAYAQAPITNEPAGMAAAKAFAETSDEMDPRQEQAFQRKQKRELIIGWTLMGAGTGLAVSAIWLSRGGGDPSAGLKRSLAVIVPGAAMVITGGGLLIHRRIKKNEHDRATQVRVGPMSISVRGHF